MTEASHTRTDSSLPDPLIGATLGGCRIERLLGRGGMGAVYYAVQLDLGRPVAVKVLPSDLAADESYITRFEREARIIAQVNHPNIVQVHFAGAEGPHRFLVLELVEGRSLAEMLKATTRLEPGQAADVILQAAQALHAAGSRGVVHRDIKPENILVTPDGLVKVADFGLAKISFDSGANTRTNQILGTPYYMSPEQAQGQPADIRSDLYALGLTFWQCLSGRRPYQAETALAVLLMQVSEPLPDIAKIAPGTPPDLADLISAMTRKNREDRTQAPLEVIAALKAYLARETRHEPLRAPSGFVAPTSHVDAEPTTSTAFSALQLAAASPAREGDCPHCRTPNPEERRYCGSCGAALFEACPQCGSADNALGAKFCGGCGADLAVQRQVRVMLEKVSPLVRAGRREEALRILESAQQLAPDRADLRRWGSELHGDIETMERLRADFRRCLERDRLDLAEHVAVELIKRSPQEEGVRDEIERRRSRMRDNQFAGLKEQFDALLAERKLVAAAAKLAQIETLDPDGPVTRDLQARLDEKQSEYDGARAWAVPFISTGRWREAVNGLKAAEALNVECPDVQEMLKTAAGRLAKLEGGKSAIEKAIASSQLFRAYDLASEVRALDPANDVLEDLPERLTAALAKFKSRFAEAEQAAASRQWKDALERCEKLRSIEAYDGRLQELYTQCARTVKGIEEARQHLERYRTEPLRFPDLIHHIEVLEAKLPEVEVGAVKDLAAELESAYVTRASREITKLVVRARTAEARAMITALQTFDPVGAQTLQGAYRRGVAFRWLIDAGVVVGICGLGMVFYGLYRLFR